MTSYSILAPYSTLAYPIIIAMLLLKMRLLNNPHVSQSSIPVEYYYGYYKCIKTVIMITFLISLFHVSIVSINIYKYQITWL